jgi:hypothetical protein
LRKKKYTDNKQRSAEQPKTKREGKLQQERWRKREGERRHHLPGQERGAEAGVLEGADHLHQLRLPEDTLEWAGKLEGVSIAEDLRTVELAAELGVGCEEEAEVRHKGCGQYRHAATPSHTDSLLDTHIRPTNITTQQIATCRLLNYTRVTRVWGFRLSLHTQRQI